LRLEHPQTRKKKKIMKNLVIFIQNSLGILMVPIWNISTTGKIVWTTSNSLSNC
jgi:hypothetical protein